MFCELAPYTSARLLPANATGASKNDLRDQKMRKNLAQSRRRLH